jgi:hypothetical protein
LVNSAKETIGILTKKDVLVFWRGGVQMTYARVMLRKD